MDGDEKYCDELTIQSIGVYESDGEYDPTTKKKRKTNVKSKETPVSRLDAGRGNNTYTLEENYDHLLSVSFDASFHDSGFGRMGASSSQAGFGFEDDFLGAVDAENDIGDELARELGADWGDPGGRVGGECGRGWGEAQEGGVYELLAQDLQEDEVGLLVLSVDGDVLALSCAREEEVVV